MMRNIFKGLSKILGGIFSRTTTSVAVGTTQIIIYNLNRQPSRSSSATGTVIALNPKDDFCDEIELSPEKTPANNIDNNASSKLNHSKLDEDKIHFSSCNYSRFSY